MEDVTQFGKKKNQCTVYKVQQNLMFKLVFKLRWCLAEQKSCHVPVSEGDITIYKESINM